MVEERVQEAVRRTVRSENPQQHTLLEDAFAFLAGTMIVAIGLALIKQAHLATGGTAGIAFLIHYVGKMPFGLVLFLINLPFYLFAWLSMGRTFTLKTFIAVGMLSLETALMPQWVQFSILSPPFAAVAGGILMGLGVLALMRHKASLGGVGILAFYCQEKLGWRAGKVQLAADACIALSALAVMSPAQVATSVLGVVTLNLILTINHKPGRYNGI